MKVNDDKFPKNVSMEKFMLPVFKQIHEEKIYFSRDISRMIPVERACTASIENFEKYIKELIDLNFQDENST